MRRYLLPFVLIIIILLTGCKTSSNGTSLSKDWEMIEDSGRNSTVNFYIQDGNEEANDWIDTYLKPKLAEKYNIKLNRIAIDYEDIFDQFKTDKEKENNSGEIDLLWIKGDNFKYAYNKEYLYGPFVHKLPNYNKYINNKGPEVKYDLMYPTSGFEAPFGKTQFTLFYNQDVIFDEPKTTDDLLELFRSNPGMFTYPAPPDADGSAFVRSIIYSQVSYKDLSEMDVNKASIRKVIEPGIRYLKSIEPYLWEKGLSYPKSGRELDKLFMDGDLLMSMSYDQNHGTDMLKEFLYPEGAKPLFIEDSMVGATHYLSIAYNSTNKSGSMVVINECLSIDAQANKFSVRSWGDIPVLDRNLLSTDELRQINRAVSKKTSPKFDIMLDNRVPEMSTEIQKLINEIWIEEFMQ